ncbi:MAG TPA: zinc-binding alcohol dehydrogenase family protein [Chitinophagaceae bacterium]|nr:zinc-binding alcohol dehydrogenase family protein [Chitinophagaceae bacterium]
MKALCVQSPNNMVIEERPMPVITSPTEVLIKVKAGGICGSDVHIYHGTSSVAVYPRVPGHEIAGEILETGNDVNGFSPGDHVIMDPVISCGNCYQCRIGRRNVCGKLQVRSVHVDGGYQEYIVMPRENIYHIPGNLSWEEAIMIEPFTIAEQVCSRAAISKDDTVFIMGAGPVGLSILKMVKLYGATCFISDVMEYKLDAAKQFGADVVINAKNADVKEEILKLTDGNGASVVIDAACTTKSFEQALTYVCAAGRVITLGFNKELAAISQLSITAREIDVRGSRLHNNKFPTVIAYFTSGKLKVKDMITHRFNFTAIHDALHVIENPAIENGKVVLFF